MKSIRKFKKQEIDLSANLIIDSWCIGQTLQISGNKVFPNTYLGRFEADIFEITKSGYLYEYEVKISRADFKAEKKKTGKKEKLLSGERCNYFSYLVPEGLILPDEVPEYAGLVYINGVRYSPARKMGNYDDPDWMFPHLITTVVKNPPKLSGEKLGDKWLSKLMESTYNRFHQRTIWSKYETDETLEETREAHS